MRTIGYFAPWYGHRVAPPVLFQLLADQEQIMVTPGFRLELAHLDVLGIDLARNNAIQWSLENGHDYLVMQDADTYANGVPPIMAMVRALEQTQATIVGAPYILRRDESRMSVVPEPNGEPVYTAQSVGTGLIAIRMAEIRRIAADYSGAWFKREFEDERETVVRTTGDVFFSNLIRAHGGDVVVDARIPTVHDRVTQQQYSPTPGATAEATPDEER